MASEDYEELQRQREQRDQQILRDAKARLKRAIEDDGDNRTKALEDLQFIAVDGAQWPEVIKAERTAERRPCLTINKMPTFIDQVVGDQRQNRPAIKVLPVDDKADIPRAQILSGWIKHVQSISSSDVAIDHGFEHTVMCGYGAMRVVTEYTADDSFEQDAKIKKVDNALAIYWGPHVEYDCSDAVYCFLISEMDRDEFKRQYNTEPMPFEGSDIRFAESWSSSDTVRVAEYFVKEPTQKTIYKLSDNKVVDDITNIPEGTTVITQREVASYKIRWYLLSGNTVLDERDWVGKKYIPVIPIWGKEVNVGGKRVIRGLIRNAKDPQRMYNYWQSSDTEIVALAPKNPYILTPKQIDGHEDMWKNAVNRNYFYLLTNSDPQAPGWPHREAPPQASSAMVEKMRQADQEIRDTMGLQKASLGMQSNERSGVAIRERKIEGDTGTFAFIDNLSRSIEHLGRILVDIAPGILSNERIIRLGLENDLQKFVAINTPGVNGEIFNDMSIGKYDVVVKVGPSFTTQRTEARQSMSEFIQYVPQAGALIGDIYADMMDWNRADEVSERLTYLLPPELRQKLAEKKATETGEPGPSTEPPPPDPLTMAKLQEEKLNLEILQIKKQQEQEKLGALQIDNTIKMTTPPPSEEKKTEKTVY